MKTSEAILEAQAAASRIFASDTAITGCVIDLWLVAGVGIDEAIRYAVCEARADQTARIVAFAACEGVATMISANWRAFTVHTQDGYMAAAQVAAERAVNADRFASR